MAPPPSEPLYSSPYSHHLKHYFIRHLSTLTSSRPVSISASSTYLDPRSSIATYSLTFTDTHERWAIRAHLTPRQYDHLQKNKKGTPFEEDEEDGQPMRARRRAGGEVKTRERLRAMGVRSALPVLYGHVLSPPTGLPPVLFLSWPDGRSLSDDSRWERASEREREKVLRQLARHTAEVIRASVNASTPDKEWDVQRWFERAIDKRTRDIVAGKHKGNLLLSCAQRALAPELIDSDLASYAPVLMHLDLSPENIIADADWNMSITTPTHRTFQHVPLQLALILPALLHPLLPPARISPQLKRDRASYTTALLSALPPQIHASVRRAHLNNWRTHLDDWRASVGALSAVREEAWDVWERELAVLEPRQGWNAGVRQESVASHSSSSASSTTVRSPRVASPEVSPVSTAPTSIGPTASPPVEEQPFEGAQQKKGVRVLGRLKAGLAGAVARRAVSH